ncbi:MAG: 7-carboxy-7-deazaguanine synthase QueE [Rickettsiales bacterium]
MHGNNPIRKPKSGDGQYLDIQEIFATLQGEGIYVGMPAVFIRLGGCNLACDFCDTEFESFTELSLNEVLTKVKELSLNQDGQFVRKLVVITGGEPFRQNIAPLCEQLISSGFKVQIETNGTLCRQLPAEVDIVCSPKNTGQGYAPIREDLLRNLSALKFIISASDGKYKEVVEIGQSKYSIPVFVQPMDEEDVVKNKANTKLALELAIENGYRLSLQTHKILGIE